MGKFRAPAPGKTRFRSTPGPCGKLKPDWETKMWPTLKNALKKSKFKNFTKRAFPNTCLSNTDMHEALHFVRFIMKVKTEERPTTSRVKMHPFLKTESNPFIKVLNSHLRKELDCVNPFKRMLNFRVASGPGISGNLEKSVKGKGIL